VVRLCPSFSRFFQPRTRLSLNNRTLLPIIVAMKRMEGTNLVYSIIPHL
jgi:hypothetical protein